MFNNILVNRFGTTHNSFMKTINVINEIQPNLNYKILLSNLILSENRIKEHKIPEQKIQIPKFLEIDNIWLKEEVINNNDNNILGNFGKFITEKNLIIPINIATSENVKYYGATLYNLYDNISFDSEKILPLTEMVIGLDYVKNYIDIENLGGGQYLEYHNAPHFHFSVSPDNSGYYILGKIINNKIRLSAYFIPFKQALYTPSNIIHSDANLVGKWLVVYSKTDKYSTVLLRDYNNKLIKIIFS